MDSGGGGCCLQVKVMPNFISKVGEEIRRSEWVSVLNYYLDSVKEIMYNYLQLVCNIILRSRII